MLLLFVNWVKINVLKFTSAVKTSKDAPLLIIPLRLVNRITPMVHVVHLLLCVSLHVLSSFLARGGGGWVLVLDSFVVVEIPFAPLNNNERLDSEVTSILPPIES